jgi:hypothetical protein
VRPCESIMRRPARTASGAAGSGCCGIRSIPALPALICGNAIVPENSVPLPARTGSGTFAVPIECGASVRKAW